MHRYLKNLFKLHRPLIPRLGEVLELVGDIFMFDEPSSHLGLNAAVTTRSLIHPYKFITVVEHNLLVLDYLLDFIFCLYGVTGAYGVVTILISDREDINIFLDGFVTTKNLRYHDELLVFKVAESFNGEEIKRINHYKYQAMKKQWDHLS